jgi:hypothetical protein
MRIRYVSTAGVDDKPSCSASRRGFSAEKAEGKNQKHFRVLLLLLKGVPKPEGLVCLLDGFGCV